jgi:hypothetical protein
MRIIKYIYADKGPFSVLLEKTMPTTLNTITRKTAEHIPIIM